MSKNHQYIDYYENKHWLSKLQTKTSFKIRKKMVSIWFLYHKINQHESIFDIGATPDCERLDSNCMIPIFQQKTKNITLFSPEKIDHLRQVFPGIKLRYSISNESKVPKAKNKEFDYVTSSAVLEHVGSDTEQKRFLKKAGDIATKGLFITTPNRFHFIEFHTKLLFIHWFPKKIHRFILRKIGLNFWEKESNLNLLSYKSFYKMARETLGQEFDVVIKKVYFLFVPSNLILIATRKNIRN